MQLKEPGLRPGFFVPAIWLLFTIQALIRPWFRGGIRPPEWLDCSRHRLWPGALDDVFLDLFLHQLLNWYPEFGGCLRQELDVFLIRDLP
jgi:hypothetical protein